MKSHRRELTESLWHWSFVLLAFVGALYHERRRYGIPKAIPTTPPIPTMMNAASIHQCMPNTRAATRMAMQTKKVTTKVIMGRGYHGR